MADERKARRRVAHVDTGPRRILREVKVEELKSSLLHSMVAAPIQALELERRVPEFCRKRGWPSVPEYVAKGGNGFEWYAVPVCAYRVGARGQRLTVPKACLQHPRWVEFVKQFGERPTAEEIVEAMEMDDLLGEEAQHELVETP